MTQAFDQRIVQVGIDIEGDHVLFEGLDIRASGQKFASPTQNICRIQISNMTKAQRNHILTKATPLAARGQNRQSVHVTLDVGRESYGTFRLFQGACWAISATQPPDIGIVLESLTNNPSLGLIASSSFSKLTTIKTIAQKIADSSEPKLKLEFKLKADKNIENYSYSGAIGNQVKKLAEMGGVNAYIDDDTLVVVEANTPRNDTAILIDAQGGMIGVPQPDMGGVTVKVLANSAIRIGSKVEIISEINPSVNGSYNVAAINFEIANREAPFWYTLRCVNTWYYGGTQ